MDFFMCINIYVFVSLKRHYIWALIKSPDTNGQITSLKICPKSFSCCCKHIFNFKDVLTYKMTLQIILGSKKHGNSPFPYKGNPWGQVVSTKEMHILLEQEEGHLLSGMVACPINPGKLICNKYHF